MSDATDMSSCEHERPSDQDEPQGADTEGAPCEEPCGYEPL
ncbi:hypothetical protein ABZ446_46645 [Streptomyces sp. NPDC005813]